MRSGAVIDSTGDYRYLLWREWDSERKTVAFIMLNPSRADGEINDFTVLGLLEKVVPVILCIFAVQVNRKDTA